MWVSFVWCDDDDDGYWSRRLSECLQLDVSRLGRQQEERVVRFKKKKNGKGSTINAISTTNRNFVEFVKRLLVRPLQRPINNAQPKLNGVLSRNVAEEKKGGFCFVRAVLEVLVLENEKAR